MICSIWPDSPPIQYEKNGELWCDLDNTFVETIFEDPDHSELYKGITTSDDPIFIEMSQRIYTISIANIDEDGKETGTYIKAWGFRRPFLDEFLHFAYSYFKKVNVWTAGTKAYADAIVKVTFGRLGLKPDQIASRSDCLELKGVHTKPLMKFIDPSSTEWKRTLFVDDRKDYMIFNCEDECKSGTGNAIIIPEYNAVRFNKNGSYAGLVAGCDSALLYIRLWLEKPEIYGASDLTKIDKTWDSIVKDVS